MPEWVPLGERAIRFARPAVPARALVRAVRSWPGVVDVVVTSDDVAAYFIEPPVVDPRSIAALDALVDDHEPAREIEVRVRYDGVDLGDVARTTGMTTGDVVRLHRDATYTVEMIGFAPGFAYMTGLDPRLEVPRRATPRPRVPAGSLAIAGAHTAIYPFDSPGGWHLIGTLVEGQMFGPGGALLQLGDQVRFRCD